MGVCAPGLPADGHAIGHSGSVPQGEWPPGRVLAGAVSAGQDQLEQEFGAQVGE